MAVPRVVSNESPELQQAVQAGEKLILSPGPGTVEDACYRATFRLLDRLPRFTPVLGVCLGHQILGVRFGARLEHLSRTRHGAREFIRRPGKMCRPSATGTSPFTAFSSIRNPS